MHDIERIIFERRKKTGKPAYVFEIVQDQDIIVKVRKVEIKGLEIREQP
ncbi:MAG: hypothetical protein NTY45_10775 [Elusimicrobia bacterium]|nr:hypothetical protein [Elusimicrobiota bacterium]